MGNVSARLLCVVACIAGRRCAAQLPDAQIPDTVSCRRSPCPASSSRAVTWSPARWRRRPHVAATRGCTRACASNSLARDHRAELDRDPRGELVVRAEVVGHRHHRGGVEARARTTNFLLEAHAGAGRARREDLGTADARRAGARAAASRSCASSTPRASTTSTTCTWTAVRRQPPRRSASTATAERPSGRDASAASVSSMAASTSLTRFSQNMRLQRFGCGGSHRAQRRMAPRSRPSSSTPRRRGARSSLPTCTAACPPGGAVDAVAAALGWLARERVGVINVSLVGPRNALLERVVNALVSARLPDRRRGRQRWAGGRRRCIRPRMTAWSA